LDYLKLSRVKKSHTLVAVTEKLINLESSQRRLDKRGLNGLMDYEVFEPDNEHLAQIIVRFLQGRGYSAGYQLGYRHNKIFLQTDSKQEADKISGLLKSFMETLGQDRKKLKIDKLETSITVHAPVVAMAKKVESLSLETELEPEEEPVRKCHTSRRDTFKSINGFPITRVKDEQVSMLTNNYQKRDPTKKLIIKPNFSDKVALIKFYPGMASGIIDYYVEKGFKGILLEGSGLGHVSKYCFDSIKAATAKGVVVALASQCIWGRVNMNVYDTGRDLLSFGVIPAEDMFPETALVKLMWALGQTGDTQEATALFKTNIAGEYTPRTLPQDSIL
jgi:hypothetical protein